MQHNSSIMAISDASKFVCEIMKLDSYYIFSLLPTHIVADTKCYMEREMHNTRGEGLQYNLQKHSKFF